MVGPDDGDGLSPEAKDTLARKRQEKEEQAAREAADAEADASTKSVEQRAAEGATPEEEDDGQMAMGEIIGDNVTLSKLIPKNAKVELETALMSKSVPGGNKGLISPEGETMLVLTVEVANYVPVPVRERKQGETKVKSWKIRQNLRVINAYRADSAEGRALLGLPAVAVEEDAA